VFQYAGQEESCWNTDSDENRQISVLIRDEVKKGFAEGSFDRSLKVFGLNRCGIGRV
jgi:hypothetical protein